MGACMGAVVAKVESIRKVKASVRQDFVKILGNRKTVALETLCSQYGVDLSEIKFLLDKLEDGKLAIEETFLGFEHLFIYVFEQVNFEVRIKPRMPLLQFVTKCFEVCSLSEEDLIIRALRLAFPIRETYSWPILVQFLEKIAFGKQKDQLRKLLITKFKYDGVFSPAEAASFLLRFPVLILPLLHQHQCLRNFFLGAKFWRKELHGKDDRFNLQWTDAVTITARWLLHKSMDKDVCKRLFLIEEDDFCGDNVFLKKMLSVIEGKEKNKLIVTTAVYSVMITYQNKMNSFLVSVKNVN
eukprot:TRINITY_DN780005_c0_g1_i1.p1 TRINITY_DN780005_c0_g1~~TRINITY_DN780005_c0_g1_i1.p1  ORF type:complete len:298 (+),score=39.32 TRINITY_DN780005_c0_g1_i1:126-1019(+)